MVQWVIKTRNGCGEISYSVVLYGPSNTHANDHECTTKINTSVKRNWWIDMNDQIHINTS